MWAAGDTRETTRDIVQLELFGPREGMRNGHLRRAWCRRT
jgi:hypothetical protein